MAMHKTPLPWSDHNPAQLQFLAQISSSFLRRTNWDHLDNSSNRHAYKTNEDASDPLVECEGCGVCEIAKELYYDELEDDGAAEDHDEHVVV